MYYHCARAPKAQRFQVSDNNGYATCIVILYPAHTVSSGKRLSYFGEISGAENHMLAIDLSCFGEVVVLVSV